MLRELGTYALRGDLANLISTVRHHVGQQNVVISRLREQDIIERAQLFLLDGVLRELGTYALRGDSENLVSTVRHRAGQQNVVISRLSPQDIIQRARAFLREQEPEQQRQQPQQPQEQEQQRQQPQQPQDPPRFVDPRDGGSVQSLLTDGS